LIKDVQIWVDQKMLKITMKKKVFYNNIKGQIQNLGSQKNWKGWKNLVNLKKWKP
jgi:hypothetical protein